MACIVPFDIERRVGFGIAQALSFCQHVFERAAFFAHFAQNKVAGAVDNAGNGLDSVGGQAFAQGFNHGDAAGHRRFKLHHHVFLFGQGEDFVAVFGQQFFVGGHNVFAAVNGVEHRFFGNARAAEQFDHNIHIGALHQIHRIGDPFGLRA